jgi:hypothetical protein
VTIHVAGSASRRHHGLEIRLEDGAAGHGNLKSLKIGFEAP